MGAEYEEKDDYFDDNASRKSFFDPPIENYSKFQQRTNSLKQMKTASKPDGNKMILQINRNKNRSPSDDLSSNIRMSLSDEGSQLLMSRGSGTACPHDSKHLSEVSEFDLRRSSSEG